MDTELIFWIVSAVVGAIAVGVLFYLAKREGENYITIEDYL